ncbi:glycoside hydrolase family 78 protein [Proteiniphilum sp.]|uniref:glycoside hydrolase family 78 protein n=1 Tax=Proteiniphilum sp. TaxID=1926877 RepID=UPI0033212EFD
MPLLNLLTISHKFLKPGVLIILLIFMICTQNIAYGQTLHQFRIIKLTCDYQQEPLLVSGKPHFGWQLQSEKQDVNQSAYTIEMYTRVNGKEVKIWDSGKVQSNLNQRVQYSGSQMLEPGTTYLWRVKAWDSDNNASAWSEMHRFRMAPSDTGLKAKWIGAIDRKDAHIPEGRDYHGLAMSSEAGKKWQDTHPLSRRSIYLRKDFSTDRKVKDAIIYISGLGHYELSLNGEKVGDSQFDPMWSDYDKTIYYNAYDITDALQRDNAIGVLLGNGFFNQQGGRYVKMQVSFGPPTLFFKLHITYTDGTKQEIASDESWKYSLSPLVFNDMYGGEDYDARLEQRGWDSFGFDESDWHPVVVQSAPDGQLTPQATASVKIMETYLPKSVKKVGDAHVFDMGQNLSGFPMIKVSGKPGDKVRLTVGEKIHEDGTIDQSRSGSPYYYEYTLKGGPEEVWHPRFSYYGYKYIQADGIKPNEVESHFVYNSSAQTGRFHCSNEIFNEAHRIIVNAIKSNMHAVFTDCPHREKLGWLEQIHLNGPGLFYNFDLTTFAPKIMQDIRDAQLPNGLVPDIAPEYVVFKDGFRDSPEWGSTAVFLPFMYYRFYGDNSLIIKYYDVMKKYVDYLSSTATDHIVSHGLGDWCDYRKNEPYGPSKNTPVSLSASTHYYMVIDYLAQAAEITNNRNDFTFYSKLRKQVKDAFNKEFFDENTRQYGTGSQASNAMPLFAGIVEPEYTQAVLDNLVKDIQEKGYRLSTGDVGNRYLFQTLADNGLNEIMYKMQNHREVPGYGFQLQFGTTTLTELWDPRDGASWNHFMMGQIEEWFYKSLAGITTEDYSGFRNIVIAPKPVGDLKFVEASYDTLYGTVSVNWKIDGDQFRMDLSVPHNCTAKVYLPQQEDCLSVGSGNHSFTTTITMDEYANVNNENSLLPLL